MKRFMKQYDLSSKTVIPFNTNAGYGVCGSFKTVKDLCPRSNILEGFSIKGGIERDNIYLALQRERSKQADQAVKAWLNKGNILTNKE